MRHGAVLVLPAAREVVGLVLQGEEKRVLGLLLPWERRRSRCVRLWILGLEEISKKIRFRSRFR